MTFYETRSMRELVAYLSMVWGFGRRRLGWRWTGGDVSNVVREEALEGRAAFAVLRAVGGAGEARPAREERILGEAKDGRHEARPRARRGHDL